MAGEIQLNSTTALTEDTGAITLNNVNSATNRTNLGLGSIATQASGSIDIDGGAIDGVTIGTNSAATDVRVDNLKLDGNTISSTNTDGNIVLDPNGAGNVLIGNFTLDADQTVGAGQDNMVLTYDYAQGTIGLEAAANSGTIASQDSDAVAITGGSITGTEIDLKSTGTSVYKSDGTTAVISESSGTVTVNNSTLGNSVVFPSGHIIKVNYYTIGSGTLTNASFPVDNTIPQRTEGTQVWSQSITPSASANYLLIQAHVKLNETSSLTNEMALGLFISDSLDALVVSQGLNERSSGGGPFNDFPAFINYRMASWGASAKTLSLRSSGAQAYNYFDQYGSYSSGSYYNGTITSSVIIWEIV